MRRFFFAFLFALISHSLFAQWDVVEELFVPPQYYMGDSVLLQFRIVMDKEMEIVAPSQLPSSEWLEIESVHVQQEGYEALVSIHFRSFQTGTRTLPPLSLGEISLDSLKIFTSSLAEENNIKEIRGIRENQNFPGIGILLGLFILLLIFSPYLMILAIRMMIQKMNSLYKWLLRGGPRRRVKRLMNKLETRVEDSGQERDFYIDLSQGIRSYLSDQTGSDYFSLTTRDMRSNRCGGIGRELWSSVIELLTMADLVKFAGQKVTRKDKLWSMEILKELINTVEREDS